MKIETRFFHHSRYWNNIDKLLSSNKPHSYVLLCENRGSFIAITPGLTANSSFFIYVQIGSWTLEYRVWRS